jgi:hypothetical protein
MKPLTRMLVPLVVAGVLLGLPEAGHGQEDMDGLAARCALTGASQTRCTELALTARALQGHVGLLAGLGSEVSGSAGTLGRRLGATPRVSVGARAGFASVRLPDLADQGIEPSREASFIVPTLHAGVAVGLFDGIQLNPTVGGFLSLDLLAQTSVLFLPTGEGFDGSTTGYSFGARMGIFRESFTLPGIAVSLSRRNVGTVLYGDAQGAGGGSVEVDPNVVSVRMTVGKDILSVGVLVGIGWDRYSGAATIRAAADGGAVASESDSSFNHSQRLIFGGASLNFLILQLSAEVGWAGGFDDVTEYFGDQFDPTAGTAYGSLAFRITI